MTEVQPCIRLAGILSECADDPRPFAAGKDGFVSRADFALRASGWKKAVARSRAARVAVYHPDIFEAASILFGCWAAGAHAVLVSDTGRALLDELENGAADTAAGNFPAELNLPHIGFVETDEPCRDTLEETREAVSIFTSGSTGKPTLIAKRLSQLFIEAENIARFNHGAPGNISPDAVIFSTVSAQHIYGLLFALLWPLSSCRPVWRERILYPEEMLGHMLGFAHCVWIASPAHLKRLNPHPLWGKVKGRIEAVYSSGGPLPEEGAAHTYALAGVPVTEIYGSSEAGGVAHRSRTFDDAGTAHNTAYRPVAGVQWRIRNDLMEIKSAHLYTSDWEATNDKVRALPDGSFELLGRADRIVKIEAKRVSLTAVENALTATGLIKQAKAFVRKDTSGRELIAIAAVPAINGIDILKNEGKRVLVRKLRAVLLEHIERVCLPRQWRFTESLPENSMGKTTLHALVLLFDERAAQSVRIDAADTPDQAQALVFVSALSPFFEGHFPQFALLPGLTQLDWAERHARRYFSITAELCGVKNLKFMRPIKPGATVLLNLARADSRVTFSFNSVEGETLAKGILLFTEEPR